MNTAREYLGKLGELYPQSNSGVIWENLEIIWNGIEQNLKIPKPENLDSIFKSFRDIYYDCFKRLCEYYDKSDKNNIYLGYFPIIDFNAKANTTKNNDRVVVYDEYLNSFLTEIFVIFFNLAYNDELSDAEKINCNKNFARNLMLFRMRNQMNVDEIREKLDFFNILATKDYDYMFWSAVGCNSIYYFIIAHEIGHHYLGHISTKEKQFLGFNNTETIDVDVYQHNQEFEADEYAFSIFLKITSEIRDNDNTNVSIYFDRFPILFFDLMEYYYQTMIKKGLIKDIPASHPSPMDRKQNILEKFKMNLSKEGERFYFDLKTQLDKMEIK